MCMWCWRKAQLKPTSYKKSLNLFHIEIINLRGKSGIGTDKLLELQFLVPVYLHIPFSPSRG